MKPVHRCSGPSRTGCRGLRIVALLLLLSGAFLVLDAMFPFPQERLSPPSGVRVLDRDGVELRRFTASDGMWRFPTGLAKISPRLVTALIESEDRWFRLHPGVNPLAVVRAAWSNLIQGRVVSGASTIPMQIARMAEPRPRTLGAKIIEAFRALQLERHYTKDELLGIYLNMAPFGGNIYGVDAASRIYFGKPPDRLSLGECALLAVLPRSPSRYDPARHPKTARRVRDRVLDTLAGSGVIGVTEAARAKRQPMVASRRSSRMLAPHFTLLARHRLGAATVLETSLDRDSQRVVQRLTARHVARIQHQGLHNAAVVVLDRRTREVLAMAGSADFFDDRTQGQVNNALAARSPGSTLKPFLYALAFDKGTALPGSRLLDVPTDYSGYRPDNYSGTFSGQVDASHALSRSLNVPAVRLLARTGLDDFHRLLTKGGLESIDRPAASYGLPLALGACEVRLMDLTNLYATLAQGGAHRPWRIAPGDPGPGTALFSPEATHMVSEILTNVARPDMPESWRLTRDRPAAAWKTGTSFGHRDAWAVGFGPTLAVGVWVGNPDGSPVKGISGSRHAGPLLFDVLRALEPASRDLHLPKAPELRTIRLCAASRLPAGPDCPEVVETVAGPRMSLPRCTDHRRVLVDAQTGLRLQGDCLLRRPATSEVVRTVPPELAAWLAAQHRPVPAPPEPSPLCTGVPDGGPSITSPSGDTPYLLRDDAPSEYQQIVLEAATGEPDRPLWWYVDNRFAGKSTGDDKLFHHARPGIHRVSVTDEQGRTDSLTFTVR